MRDGHRLKGVCLRQRHLSTCIGVDTKSDGFQLEHAMRTSPSTIESSDFTNGAGAKLYTTSTVLPMRSQARMRTAHLVGAEYLERGRGKPLFIPQHYSLCMPSPFIMIMGNTFLPCANTDSCTVALFQGMVTIITCTIYNTCHLDCLLALKEPP